MMLGDATGIVFWAVTDAWGELAGGQESNFYGIYRLVQSLN
jgi:hypothetical protein